MTTPAERARRAREAQGLPPKVDDPAALARIAALIRSTPTPEEAPRRGDPPHRERGAA
jgi:hypothetical protein